MCKRRSTDYRLLEQLEGPQININFNLDLGASKTRQYLKKLPTTQTKVFLCTSSFITHLDEISDDYKSKNKKPASFIQTMFRL